MTTDVRTQGHGTPSPGGALRMNALFLGLILITVGLGVAGELLFKTGAMQISSLDFSSFPSALGVVASLLTNPRILLGFCCYGLGAILWILVLTRLDLSYAYPMYALMYAIIPLAAHYVLKEEIPAARWAGIALIVIGVLIVVRFGAPQV
jgi:drug/metabolite transporter (DMT)-like permease